MNDEAQGERDPGSPFERCQWCGAHDGFLVGSNRPDCVRCGTPHNGTPPGRGKGEYVIGLVGLEAPGSPPTGFEGMFLVEYDPWRPGHTPDGRPLMAHILASNDLSLALRFEDIVASRAEWMRWDGKYRPDGKPSRPLTAFTIQTEKALRKE